MPCSDRLGELERDKQKLQERLASHRRETLSRDMDYWKKTNNNKSKNILKKGLKKLKGKIQVSVRIIKMQWIILKKGKNCKMNGSSIEKCYIDIKYGKMMGLKNQGVIQRNILKNGLKKLKGKLQVSVTSVRMIEEIPL